MDISKQHKQVITLYASTFGGIIVGVLVSVLNTRSLSPVEFGDYQYVNQTINFIAGFLLFGYFISGSRLLALSDTEEKSRHIRGVMVAILFAATLVLWLVLVGDAIVHSFMLDKPGIAGLLLFSILISPNALLLNYINTTSQGDNHISRIAIARLLPSVVYVIVAYLVFKYTGASALKMLLLHGGIGFIIYVIIIWSTRPKFSRLKSTFVDLNRENRNYGFNVYVGSIANVALGYLGAITLGLFNNDNASVAFFTLALTISGPLSTLPSIIGTVYFKKFASTNCIDRRIMYGTLLLTGLSFLAYIIVIHPVVGFLYDSSYSIVSVYACFLALAASIQGFADMVNRFLGAHGKGREIRNGAFVSGFFLVFGNTVLVYFFDISGAIIARILGSLSMCLTLLYYYKKYLKSLQGKID